MLQAPRGAEGHGLGEQRGPVQPPGHAGLEIGADQQGVLRLLLQAVQEKRGLLGPTLHENRAADRDAHGQAADVVAAQIVTEGGVHRALRAHVLRADPDHEELADFLLERELVESPAGPGFAVQIGDGRSGDVGALRGRSAAEGRQAEGGRKQ